MPKLPAGHPYAAPAQPAQFSVTLHCNEGSSDKIYQLFMVPEGNLWRVDYANARRGSPLQPKQKQAAAPWAKAVKAYEDTLAEKLFSGKGYEVIQSAGFGAVDAAPVARFVDPAGGAGSDTGLRPQLLKELDNDDVETIAALERSNRHCAQQKHNGERRFVRSTAAEDGNGWVIDGANKKGRALALTPVIAEEARRLNRQFVIDSEQVGDRCIAFDLLELDGEDLRPLPYKDRLAKLYSLGLRKDSALIATWTGFSTEEKVKLAQKLMAVNAEGVVYKDLLAPYTPGEPNSAREPTQLKRKFYATLSAIVAHHNEKHSVGLALLADDTGNRLPVGNVTIPESTDLPAVGAVIEVRYLYAYEQGSLYQPIFEGLRHDVDAEECLASQRKFRGEDHAHELAM